MADSVSKPVTAAKAMTCDKFSDMPNVVKMAIARFGYDCIRDFPIMAYTGAGCNDDFTGVHVAPTFSKNRPLTYAFDGFNHESGV